MAGAKLPLNTLRAKKHLSQKEVADKVGVNRMTYASWEKYKTYPDATQLFALADVLECNITDIFFPQYAR